MVINHYLRAILLALQGIMKAIQLNYVHYAILLVYNVIYYYSKNFNILFFFNK